MLGDEEEGESKGMADRSIVDSARVGGCRPPALSSVFHRSAIKMATTSLYG